MEIQWSLLRVVKKGEEEMIQNGPAFSWLTIVAEAHPCNFGWNRLKMKVSREQRRRDWASQFVKTSRLMPCIVCTLQLESDIVLGK